MCLKRSQRVLAYAQELERGNLHAFVASFANVQRPVSGLRDLRSDCLHVEVWHLHVCWDY